MAFVVGIARRADFLVLVGWGVSASSFWRRSLCPHSGEGRLIVIPTKASLSSFRRKPESILTFCLSTLRAGLAFVPVGFRPPSWRPSHFLCLHKESNQRNAPSVTRRPRSGRFAAVGRVWRQGSCPVAKCGPSWPAPRAGHAAFSSDLRRFTEGPESEEPGQTSLRSSLKLLRQGLPRFALPRVPPGRGEQVEEKPEGSRAGCARVCRQYRDVLPANPGACSRSRRAWMPDDRDLEGALSLVTFFGQAKKVTRPPGRRTKPHTDVTRFSRNAPRQKEKPKWIPASPE